MSNHYEVPEVVEIGTARELILGTDKSFPFVADGTNQDRRTQQMSDDE